MTAHFLFGHIGRGSKKAVQPVGTQEHREKMKELHERLRRGVEGIRRERVALELEMEGKDPDDDGEPT